MINIDRILFAFPVFLPPSKQQKKVLMELLHIHGVYSMHKHPFWSISRPLVYHVSMLTFATEMTLSQAQHIKEELEE